VIIASVIVVGCSKNYPTDQELDSSIITISREGGYYPSYTYKLLIRGDGSEVFYGYGNLLCNDTERGQIPRADAIGLIHQFIDIGYSDLKDEYDNRDVFDVGTTTTSLALAGKTKTIRNRWGGPKELKLLQHTIDSIGRIIRWLGTWEDQTTIINAGRQADFPGKATTQRLLDSLDSLQWALQRNNPSFDRRNWLKTNYYPIANKFHSIEFPIRKRTEDSLRLILKAQYSRLSLSQIDSVTGTNSARIAKLH